MTVEILTPEKNIFSGEADGIKMPGVSGSFEVLNNHAPLISALGAGELRLSQSGGKSEVLHITGGFVEVLNNKVSILIEGLQDKAAEEATA